jgi:hypothetical protein
VPVGPHYLPWAAERNPAKIANCHHAVIEEFGAEAIPGLVTHRAVMASKMH